jgi:hypothetical protein
LGLTLGDKNGEMRAGLALAPDGSPKLGLFDQNGKVLWQAR